MDELRSILDYISQIDYETLYKNLKCIKDKELQENLRKLINKYYETNDDLELEALRLYGYRKLTKSEAINGVKKALEIIIDGDDLDFYMLKENEKVFLKKLNVDTNFYKWFITNDRPVLYFELDSKTYNLKVCDLYFYNISDGENTINCDVLKAFSKSFYQALRQLSVQIRRKINELYK